MFNYDIHTVPNNEQCLCVRYPKYKKLIKHTSSYAFYIRHLVSPFKNRAVVSQHIWTPFSTVPLFRLEHVLLEPLPYSLETARLFSAKQIQMAMQKMKFQ